MWHYISQVYQMKRKAHDESSPTDKKLTRNKIKVRHRQYVDCARFSWGNKRNGVMRLLSCQHRILLYKFSLVNAEPSFFCRTIYFFFFFFNFPKWKTGKRQKSRQCGGAWEKEERKMHWMLLWKLKWIVGARMQSDFAVFYFYFFNFFACLFARIRSAAPYAGTPWHTMKIETLTHQ